MKDLKYNEIATWDSTRIERQIAENKSRLTALQFQKVIGQLDNHAQITTLRRDTARLYTALRAVKTHN